MRIDGKKMRSLLDLIKESPKTDLGHLSKGLEIEDRNGTKYTIVKLKRSRPTKQVEKGDIEALILKYYDSDLNKKYEEISIEDFLKHFKVDKKKKPNKGDKDD